MRMSVTKTTISSDPQNILQGINTLAYQKRERTDREEFARRRPAIPANDKIDLNDVEVLKNYVTEYGKIIPARVTGVTSMQQRQIKKGVRRARNMGLMA